MTIPIGSRKPGDYRCECCDADIEGNYPSNITNRLCNLCTTMAIVWAAKMARGEFLRIDEMAKRIETNQ